MIKKITRVGKNNEEKKRSIIEKKYGKDFGVRSDKKMWSSLRKQGYSSLSDLLEYDGKKR